MQSDFEKILSLAKQKDRITTMDVAHLLGVSRQAAHQKVTQLVKLEQRLVRFGKTRSAFYVLRDNTSAYPGGVFFSLRNEGLKEHEVLERVQMEFPFWSDLSEHLQSIFRYAFSEMLNNAIEHSGSSIIEIRVDLIDKKLIFEIRDYGVGVFRHVMETFTLASEVDAAGELMKGKVTTMPKAHSGEGIFFTSKIADTFLLNSYGYELLVKNLIPDVFIQSSKPLKKGTSVVFSISLNSNKHLINLFREFESEDDDRDFNKTKIHVKLYTYGTIHVSRSQARRLLEGLDKFKEIVLDFDQVPSVGQAFADEVFRVFQTAHPDIHIEVVHAEEPVQYMIDRAKKN